MIINGKQIADNILSCLKSKIEESDNKPKLAVILANDNPASRVYVNSKKNACANIGIESEVFELSNQDEILSLIDKLNKDKKTNAILVQLPLFNNLDTKTIIEAIDPIKDVDGFHPLNLGRLLSGFNPYVIPCTPLGISQIFDFYHIDLTSKKVLIVGRSNIVGKPLSVLLTSKNATVTLAHSKTNNLKELSLSSDIIISAAGHPNLITEDMVQSGTMVIDVGITKVEGKIRGDVDFENVKNKASYITPVPGGVGPMTIACLMENTYKLFKVQNEK